MFYSARRSAIAAVATAICLPAAAQAQVRSFDVPEQPAATGIYQFAEQAGIQIVVSSDEAAGRRTRPVKGELDVRAALGRLLSGTGLRGRSFDGKTAILGADARPIPAAQDETPPQELEPAIVVVGTRDQASDLKTKASNTIDVLSAEDLSHTAVHNVAEALGLLPGVNVTNTGSSGFAAGVDNTSRGEGMFVSIRGLNAEYNINLINGVQAAQASPYSRAVQLSLLPPSGLHTIVLNKTSRADMDGDAIGGTVDFRTPRPSTIAATPAAA
ncbi:STN domain-containing protein [Sphingomonas sp. dw_22]|uniref:STN domain-containing protein n=1 Tax=Sphingomonas sp. dw_22 TaxID=2721175 RepID=UPI001BD5B101|nr:STN domain-containing protein [Sphingomonas sp. dw_22]